MVNKRKGTVLVLAALLSLLPSSVALGHSGSFRPEELPVIPVTVVNNTDAFVSVGVPSALCASRFILPPGGSITIKNCFRWGLVYQVSAVFWRGYVIIERQIFLFLARPGEDWVFFKIRR